MAELLVDGSGFARLDGRLFRCAIGRTGLARNKREGDGATPMGRFPLRRILYRPDREAVPRTGLPVAVIAPSDGWCDAPEDAAYNRPVRLPYPASTEAMWRDDHLYDLVVVVGHNDDPVRPFAGSAIFLHLAREGFAPTEGCIAFARADLLAMLAALDAASALVTA